MTSDQSERNAGHGRLGLAYGRDHHSVVLVTPLAFTIVHNVTGHVAHARVIKLSSRNSTPAGLAIPVGCRRCGRCHALTFHCSNGLLKPLGLPGLLRDQGSTGVSGSVA